MSGRFPKASALAALLVASLSAPAGAQSPGVSVEWRTGGVPYVSFDARRLVDDDARARIDSGLTQHLELSVEARRPGSSRALAERSFLCDVTWDHWQQTYLVRRYVAGGASRTSSFAIAGASGTVDPEAPERRRARDRALAHCLDVRSLRVGRSSTWRDAGGASVVFEVTASLNPVTRGRCRDLLRSSSRHATPIGGVVISVLPRQICRATRALVLRSAEERPP
ncbi:MAG: hypothetical protein AAGH15_05785 [Myxococcota bacterium]